jgi:hypothetical protein
VQGHGVESASGGELRCSKKPSPHYTTYSPPALHCVRVCVCERSEYCEVKINYCSCVCLCLSTINLKSLVAGLLKLLLLCK